MLRAERAVPAGDAGRGRDGGRGAGGVELLDPAGDQRPRGSGRRRPRRGRPARVVGGGDDPVQDLGRVLVAELDALEVEDREAAEARQLAREAHVRDGVHGGGEDRDLEADAAEVLRQDDVRRVDGVGAGGQRDVLEPVGRADRVHLGAEDPAVRQRLGHRHVLSRNLGPSGGSAQSTRHAAGAILGRIVHPQRRPRSHEGCRAWPRARAGTRAPSRRTARPPTRMGRFRRAGHAWRPRPTSGSSAGSSSSCRSSRSGCGRAASRSS